ncbi:Tropinesterase [Methyloligella halotolerans]|uniref:Tropinesterase n=1 Tax=Methyloligella halotolerans TaxID=1177755 RepID=A0A1E2S2P4_9HYPH|nr:alpha/beta hydrolase [Methyloligella halotolerans]ODA68608.1 Tropinesterase [Methyloligella halotolerans]
MPTPDGELWQDIFFAASDGLRLHARHYPATEARGRPAICLPGLSRNGRDFHDLAVSLSTDTRAPRDVYAIDYRGRGLSAWDKDWENYTPLIELEDTLDFMALAGIHQAAIIGTSRGGLIALAMAALRPGAIGAVILNDIGPVIENRGLARIIGHLGKTPTPRSWSDATALVREMNERDFPAVPKEQWEEIARALFNEENGKPAPAYDPNLAKAFEGIDLRQPGAEQWGAFTALYPFPTLTLRGENSDILSEDTLEKMAELHPNLETATIAGEGHAPMLKDQRTLETISQFLAANDPSRGR